MSSDARLNAHEEQLIKDAISVELALKQQMDIYYATLTHLR